MSFALSSVFKARWFRFGLIALLGIVLALALLTYALVDTRQVTAMAASAVQKSTGRTLTINGPVTLKLFPHLSIVAEDVRLGNAAWAIDPVMVKADQVSLNLDWMSLLHDQLTINDVALRGVTLNLQSAPPTQTTGGNWDLSNTDAATPGSDQATEAFDLKAIQLSNVTIVVRDGQGVLTQSVVVDQMTGSLSDTRVDFAGRVRWQQQAMDLKGALAYKPGVPLDLTLDVQSDRIDLKASDAGHDDNAGTDRHSRWVFSADPMGLDALPLWNGRITAGIKSLVLPDGVILPNLAVQLSLSPTADGVLTIDQFKTGLGEGTLRADGKVAGYRKARPQWVLRGHAQGFTVEKVLAQARAGMKPGDFQGGPGEFAFHLNSSGLSLRDLASGANGEVQISIGPAKASTAFVNASGDFLVSLFDAINPLRKNLDYAQLDCAVAYLPLRSGLVTIAQSIGIETDRLNVVLDGQVNLRNETLNLNIYPKEKSGLTTGVNPAGLVQINGTLRNPTLGVNKAGVVKQAASVGLAVFTGGISLAAQNVASIATRHSPCQNVLKPWSSIEGGLSR
jgi:uncharacterized protein involved in outer membrane biogenesis